MTNFGDELSALVIQRVTGRPVEWRSPASADVFGIGSVLGVYVRSNSQAVVWGSGFPIDPGAHSGIERERIISVRGPRTASLLDLDDRDTVFGDPGILVGELVGAKASTRHGRVMVPHFSVFNSRTQLARMYEIAGRGGFTIVPPTLGPLEMIERIASAEMVLSSGMHAVILAHTLGTPCVRLDLGAAVPERVPFKYSDYADGVGVSIVQAGFRDLVDGPGLQLLIDEAVANAPVFAERVQVAAEKLMATAAVLRSV